MVDVLDGPEVTMILGDRAGTVLADDRFLAYFEALASIITLELTKLTFMDVIN
jgi:hypothetical protein